MITQRCIEYTIETIINWLRNTRLAIQCAPMLLNSFETEKYFPYRYFLFEFQSFHKGWKIFIENKVSRMGKHFDKLFHFAKVLRVCGSWSLTVDISSNFWKLWGFAAPWTFRKGSLTRYVINWRWKFFSKVCQLLKKPSDDSQGMFF